MRKRTNYVPGLKKKLSAADKKRAAAKRRATILKKLRLAALAKARRSKALKAAARRRAVKVSNFRRSPGKKRRLTVKRWKGTLVRSPRSRLGYRNGRKVRVNPKRRRFSLQPRALMRRWRMQRAVPILAGFAGGITVKPMIQNLVIPRLPAQMQDITLRFWGVLTIALGAMVSRRGKRNMTKDVGLGLIMGGIYDLVATNFANLPFLPKITPGMMPGMAPAAAATEETTSGLGASIGQGGFDVVGAANISSDMEPDVVGCEDLDDLI